MVASKSPFLAPSFTATAYPWVISPALGPSICNPSTRSCMGRRGGGEERGERREGGRREEKGGGEKRRGERRGEEKRGGGEKRRGQKRREERREKREERRDEQGVNNNLDPQPYIMYSLPLNPELWVPNLIFCKLTKGLQPLEKLLP